MECNDQSNPVQKKFWYKRRISHVHQKLYQFRIVFKNVDIFETITNTKRHCFILTSSKSWHFGLFCQHEKWCLVWRKIIEAKLLLTMTLDFFIWTKEFQYLKRTNDYKICKWQTDILLKMTEVDCIINHCQIFQ